MNPILYGKVEKGRIVWQEPERRAVYIASLEGKEIQESLGKKIERRTDQQNKYYWSVVVAILGNHFGYEPEEMHEALKFQFLRTHDDTLPSVRSTTKLSTAEFVDYIDRIMRWAASEYQVYIPEANEVVE